MDSAQVEGPGKGPSTTNQLLACPDEILLQILNYIPSEDRLTLYALCRVNRKIRGVSQPFLYTHIDLTLDLHPDFSVNLTTVGLYQVKPPMVLLIRTLLERPDLGLAVRHLLISAYSAAGFFTHDFEPSTRALLAQRLGPLWEDMWSDMYPIPRDSLPRTAPWPFNWWHWKTDNFAGLLLLLAPKVSHLTLGVNFSLRLGLVARLLQNNHSALAELKHIHVGSAHSPANDDDDNFEAALAVLKLPAATTTIKTSFRTSDLSWYAKEARLFPATTSTTIATLHLGGIVDENHLELLLELTPRLKILHWAPDTRPDEGAGNGPLSQRKDFDLYAIARALQHVAATLTELVIDSSPHHRPWYQGHFGTIWATMKCLERLTLPAVFLQPTIQQILPQLQLLGYAPTLPTSLQHLSLTDGEWPRRERRMDRLLTEHFVRFQHDRDQVAYIRNITSVCVEQPSYLIGSFWILHWQALTPTLRSIEVVIAIRSHSYHSVIVAALLRKLKVEAGLEVRTSEVNEFGKCPTQLVEWL